MPLRGTSQVACPTSNEQALGGRAVRAARAGEPPPSATRGGFCMSTFTARARCLVPVALAAAVNLHGVYAELTQIGRATGHRPGARNAVVKLRRQVAAIVRSVPKPKQPLSVYHELDQTYYSATSHTFIGQMYALLGLKNIADKAASASDYPQLSAEYIIASNPDLIVLADTVCCGQTKATVSARPGWGNIAAVKSGEVVPINDSIASEWGPRIVLFLKAVASAVRTLEAQK